MARINGLVRSVALVLMGAYATLSAAQGDRGLVWSLPEEVGVLERVSASPPELVIDGKRYPAALNILLTTANGANVVIPFSQFASAAVGKRIVFGATTRGGGAIDRVLLEWNDPALEQLYQSGVKE